MLTATNWTRHEYWHCVVIQLFGENVLLFRCLLYADGYQVAEITAVGFATIGWRYYIVYACINFFLILPCTSTYPYHRIVYLTTNAGVFFFYPETNGRHLEEVDQIFRDSKSIFDPVKIARRLPVHKRLARSAIMESLRLKGWKTAREHLTDCSRREA